MNMNEIKDIIECEGGKVEIYTNNNKKYLRKIRKSVNDDSRFFILNNREFYIKDVYRHLYSLR